MKVKDIFLSLLSTINVNLASINKAFFRVGELLFKLKSTSLLHGEARDKSKVTSVNSTIVTKQSRCGEYTVSLEGGGDGVIVHCDFSHLGVGLTLNTELPSPLSTYHGSFLVTDHNRYSCSVASKGVIYKLKIVPRKGVDSNIEGTSTSMEGTYKIFKRTIIFLTRHVSAV